MGSTDLYSVIADGRLMAWGTMFHGCANQLRKRKAMLVKKFDTKIKKAENKAYKYLAMKLLGRPDGLRLHDAAKALARHCVFDLGYAAVRSTCCACRCARKHERLASLIGCANCRASRHISCANWMLCGSYVIASQVRPHFTRRRI